MSGENNLLEKLTFEPAKILQYRINFQKSVQQTLTVNNPTATIVTYKLKGTSPNMIHMMPGYGYIEPNGKVDVSIKITVQSLKDYSKIAKRDHVTFIFGIPPPNCPENACKLWKSGDCPKTIRKELLKFKFDKESMKAKNKKLSTNQQQSSEKSDSYKEEEESSTTPE